MRLDVIIPSYNRASLLPSALNSLLAATVPPGLDVSITVIDNNSTDNTREVVESFQKRFGDRVQYCFEKQQGRSAALNAGIKSTTGDLIGVIDDDEEVDQNWFTVAFAALRSGDLDFIGGPYVPRWSVQPPEWLPATYGAVIGLVDGGDKEVPFDENYSGILMGGNAVFTRSILAKVGPYSTWLGRTDKGLLSGEDEELYGRLLASGAKGRYLPQLVIYHHVPSDRLTKKYYRSWCFWRGVSLGLLEKTRQQDCAYLFGVPRWHYRSAARGLIAGVAGWFAPAKREAFTSELALWDFLGLFYGRHFHRAPMSR